MIVLDAVTAHYPNRAQPVLDAISLEIAANETLVLLGGSGAGKSTILKTILRLLPIDSGSIGVDGQDIFSMERLELRRKIGMVFQGTALFPHLTVSENVALPLKLQGGDARARRQRVGDVLALVGLDPARYGGQYPHMLSGGQQQRVGVARALAPAPSYLLMDEPFGALDAVTRRMLQQELKTLRQELGITILFVTHDVMEAASLGDRIAVMEGGRIAQVGPVRALLEHPAQDCVRDLVSQPLRELKHFVRDSVA